MHTNDTSTTIKFQVRGAARWCVVVALTLAGALTATSAMAAQNQETSGGIGLRLLDAPVAAKDDPRARVYIVDHLPAGAEIQRQVEVTNTTDREQEISLYSAEATIDDGSFVGSPGRALNDLASWTSVEPGTATIPAGGKQTTLVTITVPEDAPPGEQYAVVWAEARSDAADDSGVAQVSRVGIRLYVSIGPGGAPAADFEIEALTAERTPDGEPVVSATVQNTGGRALDMSGTLELTNGPGGLTAGPFPAELGSTLAIGETGTVSVALDEQLPAGPWDAVVTLESGLTERSASATITFPASGAAAPVEVAEERSGPPWPLMLGAAALLVIVVAAGWSLRRRRLARRSRTSHAAPVHSVHAAPGSTDPKTLR
jgi:hypothetical protein